MIEPPPPLEPTDPTPKDPQVFVPGELFPDPEDGDEEEIDWTQIC